MARVVFFLRELKCFPREQKSVLQKLKRVLRKLSYSETGTCSSGTKKTFLRKLKRVLDKLTNYAGGMFNYMLPESWKCIVRQWDGIE